MARTPPLELPTVLVGPDATGRAYGVLRRSPGAELTSGQDAALADFVIALAGWGARGRERFVALFDLGEGRMALARARLLGRGTGGPIVLALVAIIDTAAWRRLDEQAHRLLARLPEPDDPAAGADRIAYDATPAAKAPRRLAPLGLAWRDRSLEVADEDLEAVLVEALDAVEPPEQRSRLQGWATTGGLARSGGFDPERAFRLIVHDPDDAPGTAGHLPARLAGGVLETETVAAPEARTVWQALRDGDRASAMRETFGALPWKPSMADLPADRAVTVSLAETCVALAPAQRLPFLEEASARAARAARALQPFLRAGVQGALGLVLDALPDEASILGVLEDAVHWAPDALAVAIDPLAQAVRLGMLREVSPETIERFAATGLLDDLAARSNVADFASLPARLLRPLVLCAMARPVEYPAHRRLVTVAGAALATSPSVQPENAALVIDLLRMLLAASGDDSDRLLAHPDIVARVQAAAPDLEGRLASRALLPALRHAEGIPRMQTLRAVVRAVDRGGRS